MRREIQSVLEKQIKCCYGNLWEHFFPAQQTIKFISCNQLSKSDTPKSERVISKLALVNRRLNLQKLLLLLSRAKWWNFLKTGAIDFSLCKGVITKLLILHLPILHRIRKLVFMFERTCQINQDVQMLKFWIISLTVRDSFRKKIGYEMNPKRNKYPI